MVKTKDILSIVLLFFSVLFLSACVTPTENINGRGVLNIHNNKSTYELIEQGGYFMLRDPVRNEVPYHPYSLIDSSVHGAADEINKYPHIEMINNDLLLFRLQAGTGLSGTISNMSDVHNVIPEYDRLERSETEFELGVIFADNIQWLSLSYIGYEKEQNMIKNYEQEDFKAINEINPNAKPTIAVGKFDINNDGIDEMIAFLGGTAHWGGAHSTGAFSVYFLTDNVITQSISLPGFDIDTNRLENSHQIGVILREEGTMDFFIMNRLFVWNGNGWR